MRKLKILIAPDKFKGSLTATEVCSSIAEGFYNSSINIEALLHPMADGGDGSLEVIITHLKLKKQYVDTVNPLGQPIKTFYYGNSETAFIELAKASGLVLLKPQQLNPLKTSTFGTGKMIAHAISKGYQQIYLFLGGSATNDGGMGIAKALGVDFLNGDQQSLLPTGENLSKVRSIKVHEDLKNVKFTLLCDVNNPLFGAEGAAFVYAKQKGASDTSIGLLEKGMKSFSELLFHHTGIEVAQIPGSGAAGGVAASLVTLFDAKIKSGIKSFVDLTKLESKIQEADLIISGEGSLDHQSLQGKVIDGIATLCRKYKKPLILFVGKNMLPKEDQQRLGIDQIISISDHASSLEDSINNASEYLKTLSPLIDLSKY